MVALTTQARSSFFPGQLDITEKKTQRAFLLNAGQMLLSPRKASLARRPHWNGDRPNSKVPVKNTLGKEYSS